MDDYPKWSRDEIFDNFYNGVVYKCKVPHNQICKANYECPKLNVCQDNVCKGFYNAPCTDSSMCDVNRRLYCQFNTNQKDVNFGRL